MSTRALSRREFLRLAALAGAGGVAAACVAPAPQPIKETVKETVVREGSHPYAAATNCHRPWPRVAG